MNEYGEQYFDYKQIHTSVLKVQCALKFTHKIIHALHMWNTVKNKMDEVRKTFLYHKNMLEWDFSIVKALL